MRFEPGAGEHGAVAVAYGDDPDDLERDQRLAERRSAHAEPGGELALRREPVPALQPVVGDPGGDLLGHLLVQPGPHQRLGIRGGLSPRICSLMAPAY